MSNKCIECNSTTNLIEYTNVDTKQKYYFCSTCLNKVDKGKFTYEVEKKLLRNLFRR
jgi:hypothetical protein